MFQKIKNAVLKKGKRIAIKLMAVASMVSVLAVGASAADSTESGSNSMSEIVNSVGVTLQNEFSALVQAIGPIVVTIAITGLGLYAIIYLFKMAKRLFTKAAS